MIITQEIINENLDNAVRNGYIDGVAVPMMSVAEIVEDLLYFSPDCEMSTAEVLTPFVQTWYDARR